jgi:hypothetical protein
MCSSRMGSLFRNDDVDDDIVVVVGGGALVIKVDTVACTCNCACDFHNDDNNGDGNNDYLTRNTITNDSLLSKLFFE